MKIPRSKIFVLSAPLAAILAVFAGYEYGYVAIRNEIASIKEEQAAKAKTLMKQTLLIYGKQEMEARLARLKEIRKSESSKFFDGQTPSISTAALLETVKGIVLGRGGKILSERSGKPEASGKFTLINASVDATLPDPRALGDILYSIESRTPWLFVKDLDVRVKAFNEPKELSIKLDVSALSGGKE